MIDLHAMRTTLGTNLAQASVAPQFAHRIMRHADYRTTLKHYTVLGLTDTTNAMRSLPGIQPQRRKTLAATGTDDAGPADDGEMDHQLTPSNQVRYHAKRPGLAPRAARLLTIPQKRNVATLSESMLQ